MITEKSARAAESGDREARRRLTSYAEDSPKMQSEAASFTTRVLQPQDRAIATTSSTQNPIVSQ
jgi:hypothetical protein